MMQRCYQAMFVNAQHAPGLSTFNRLLVSIILFSLVVTILETEPLLYAEHAVVFDALEWGLAWLFLVEYCVRVWAAGAEARYRGVLGRVRFMLSFNALVDLAAFLPSFITVGGADAFMLRLVRLARLLRFAKLGRYSNAIHNIEVALRSCARELLVSLLIAFSLIVLGASLLYVVEGSAQPEAFGSIPRALWWSVITLTTVGYGDVYPVTALGQFCAGVMAFVGIATVALPAGILAAAFQDGYRRSEQSASSTRRLSVEPQSTLQKD